MRGKYSDLVTIKAWPALSEHTTERNLSDIGEQKNRNGMECHGCSSEYHLKFGFPKSQESPSDQQEGIGTGKTQKTQNGSSD